MHSDWTEFGHGFWDNSQQAAVCGELIDTNHKTILQLAQRFSLPTVDLLAAPTSRSCRRAGRDRPDVPSSCGR
jgi:hypothetical protein